MTVRVEGRGERVAAVAVALAAGALVVWAGCGSSASPEDAGPGDSGEIGQSPPYDAGTQVTYAALTGPEGFTPAGAVVQYLDLADGGNAQTTLVITDYPIGCSPTEPQPNQHELTITLNGTASTSGYYLVLDPLQNPSGQNGIASATLLYQDNTYYGVQGMVTLTNAAPNALAGSFTLDLSDQPMGADQMQLAGTFSQLIPCPE